MASPKEVREVIFKALKDVNADVRTFHGHEGVTVTFTLNGSIQFTDWELSQADPAHLLSVLCTRLNKMSDEATKLSKQLWSLYDGEKRCLKK